MRHAAPEQPGRFRRLPLSERARAQRRRAWIAIAAVVVVAAVAIGAAVTLSGGGSDHVALRDPQAGAVGTDPVASSAVASTSTTAPTTTTRGPLGSGQPVTIGFGGDSHFEAHLRSRLANEGASMLAPLGPLFDGADLTVLNLETAITERGTPVAKEYTFRAPPAALDALAGAGVDAVSMANNHGIDFGPEGLEDSLAARAAAPLSVIGIGANAADAYSPFLAEVNGQRIAVIGATQVLDDFLIPVWTATDTQPGLASAKEVDQLVAAVQSARAQADTVVVFLHWGLERQECPTETQKALAPVLLDAGADIVVGGHAHRLEGAGRMGEGFVAYGLGNFIWFNESGPNGDSGALLVTATGRQIDSYEWRPARIRNGVPTMLEGAERDAALASWDALRACTGLTP